MDEENVAWSSRYIAIRILSSLSSGQHPVLSRRISSTVWLRQNAGWLTATSDRERRSTPVLPMAMIAACPLSVQGSRPARRASQTAQYSPPNCPRAVPRFQARRAAGSATAKTLHHIGNHLRRNNRQDRCRPTGSTMTPKPLPHARRSSTNWNRSSGDEHSNIAPVPLRLQNSYSRQTKKFHDDSRHHHNHKTPPAIARLVRPKWPTRSTRGW